MMRKFRPLSRQLAAVAICSLTAAACGGKSESGVADTMNGGTTAAGVPVTSADALPTVRGTVVSVSTTNLVIKTDTGNVNVRVTQPFRVYNREPAKLADVKDNSFIGVTTVKQPDGAERATEIHIFPEELRGMGEGSRMMAQSTSGGGSRMTNGAVSTPRMTNGAASQSRMSNGSVANATDSTVLVQYSGGSQKVAVPRNTPVTELKATSRSLKAGDRVVVLAIREAGGSLSSDKALLAGK